MPTSRESNVSTGQDKDMDANDGLGLHRVDGGCEAWIVIAGASLALFVQFGQGSDFFSFEVFMWY